MPAERLIDAVWETEPPAAARNVLQTYVSRLRKLVGTDRLEQRAGGYVLHAELQELDASRFEVLFDARHHASSAVSSSSPETPLIEIFGKFSSLREPEGPDCPRD